MLSAFLSPRPILTRSHLHQCHTSSTCDLATRPAHNTPLLRCATHTTTTTTRCAASDKPPSTTAKPPTYSASLLRSVTELSRAEWDYFAQAGDHSPFVLYDWIRSLEASGSASAATGWTPSHVVLRDMATDAVVAIAPAYIKAHSYGEFVFDQQWADAAFHAGLPYYPKLLLAVPFTPAADRRILTSPLLSPQQRADILRMVAGALVQIAHTLPVSSIHVNFCREDEVLALQSANFLMRKGVQYHFTNCRKGQAAISAFETRLTTDQRHVFDNADPFGHAGVGAKIPYRNFDDYLGDFKSKRRIKMRRERQVVRHESGLRIEVLRGDQIDSSVMNYMFDIYKSTIDKMLYGRQYLCREFFQMLDACSDFKEHICLVLARKECTGEIVGGTFNIIGNGSGDNGGVFYGRYWGCTEEFRYLHFEACYYAAIEYCIENGLARMEPGAGGGEFKYMRGFEPSVTMSMHYLRDERLSDAVAHFLQVETAHIDGAVIEMKEQSAIRSKGTKGT